MSTNTASAAREARAAADLERYHADQWRRVSEHSTLLAWARASLEGDACSVPCTCEYLDPHGLGPCFRCRVRHIVEGHAAEAQPVDPESTWEG